MKDPNDCYTVDFFLDCPLGDEDKIDALIDKAIAKSVYDSDVSYFGVTLRRNNVD